MELVKTLDIKDHKDPVPLVFSVIGLSTAVGRGFAGWIADRPWATLPTCRWWQLDLVFVQVIIKK